MGRPESRKRWVRGRYLEETPVVLGEAVLVVEGGGGELLGVADEDEFVRLEAQRDDVGGLGALRGLVDDDGFDVVVVPVHFL